MKSEEEEEEVGKKNVVFVVMTLTGHFIRFSPVIRTRT